MDIEKTMQFILEQQAQMQAQFAVQHQKNIEEHERFREDLGRLAGVVEGVIKVVDRAANNQDRHQEQIVQNQEQIGQLIEAQKHTDERLNALIKVVDDLVRRNGSHS